jgi:3-oxoacyl-[acyl-carrier protein] reductase
MSDFLLSLSRSAVAQRVVKQAGLPIPLPPILNRLSSPWVHGTLEGKNIALRGLDSNGVFYTSLLRILSDSRAKVSDSSSKLSGMLIDASGLKTPQALRELYLDVRECVGGLLSGAHVLLVTRRHSPLTPPVVAGTQEALRGFTRSLAKELGPRGVTVNQVAADEGVALGGIVRFLMSDHSSFISGQVLEARGGSRFEAKFERLLDGKVILVTGAAHGIGAAIARRAAAEGAKVLLLDKPQEMTALEALAREVHGIMIPVDLMKDEALPLTLKKLREFAPVHGVVHNAGITRDRSLFNMRVDAWDSVIGLNLNVPIAMTELMLSQDHDYVCAKDASFVFLSSVGGIAGNPGQTNYASSKAGLIGYAESRAELAATVSTRFNCVAPGFIETRMTKAMPMAVREVARRFNSLKQAGEPDDVAQAVVFLLSEASLGLNGETLRVCGQNLIGR